VGALALSREALAPSATQGTVLAAIANGDIAAGTLLQRSDVGTAAILPDSPLRSVALQPGDVVGLRATGDLAAGEMLTETRVADGDGAPPGYTTMPVTFADAKLAAFLAPGMQLDIVWTPDDLSGQPPQVVARLARVVRLPAADEGRLGPAGGLGVPVLLQVAEADAVGLAAAMGSGSLSILLR